MLPIQPLLELGTLFFADDSMVKTSTYFRFPAKYSIANTGQRGTLRMFVLTAEMSHKRKMEARSKENQMT